MHPFIETYLNYNNYVTDINESMATSISLLEPQIKIIDDSYKDLNFLEIEFSFNYEYFLEEINMLNPKDSNFEEKKENLRLNINGIYERYKQNLDKMKEICNRIAGEMHNVLETAESFKVKDNLFLKEIPISIKHSKLLKQYKDAHEQGFTTFLEQENKIDNYESSFLKSKEKLETYDSSEFFKNINFCIKKLDSLKNSDLVVSNQNYDLNNEEIYSDNIIINKEIINNTQILDVTIEPLNLNSNSFLQVDEVILYNENITNINVNSVSNETKTTVILDKNNNKYYIENNKQEIKNESNNSKIIKYVLIALGILTVGTFVYIGYKNDYFSFFDNNVDDIASSTLENAPKFLN